MNILTIHRDVPMSPDEVGFFLRKMFRQLELLELEEIPHLVNQMLPLSGTSHHETLLRGLFSTFVKLNKDAISKRKKSAKGLQIYIS